jgi:hypothetical protein
MRVWCRAIIFIPEDCTHSVSVTAVSKVHGSRRFWNGPADMPEFHSHALVARNRTMLTTGRYSDLTINCGGEVFKVHQVILRPASKFFEAVCDGGFVVGEARDSMRIHDCRREGNPRNRRRLQSTGRMMMIL